MVWKLLYSIVSSLASWVLIWNYTGNGWDGVGWMGGLFVFVSVA